MSTPEVQQALKSADQKMKQAVAVTHEELNRIRTGRASPSFVEHMSIDAYGTSTPLNQLASINVEQHRLEPRIERDQPRRFAHFTVELNAGELEVERLALVAGDELQAHLAGLLLRATYDEQLAFRIRMHDASFARRWLE